MYRYNTIQYNTMLNVVLQSLQRVSTIHRVARLQNRLGRTSTRPFKYTMHWDGKFLRDVTGIDTNKIDRLTVLVTSLVGGDKKILGVPKLASGSGKAAAYPAFSSGSYGSVTTGM